MRVNLGMKWSEKYAATPSGDETEYPELCLNDAQAKEAGVTSTPVGTLMTMTATVCLCERKEDDENGMRIEFEIQDASFTGKEKPKDAASVLFPNG